MASEEVIYGIWVDLAEKSVTICPGCLLESLGQPVNLKNVLAALLTATVYLKNVKGIELVGFDVASEARRYWENYQNGRIEHPH